MNPTRKTKNDIIKNIFNWKHTFAVALLAAASPIPAQEQTTAPRLDVLPDAGVRAYHLGNSHTDSMRAELAGLIWAGGDADYRFGNRTIPGAPLRFIAGNPGSAFEELAGQSWDFLIMQSYNSTNEEEIQAAIAFTRAARQGNPEVTVLMYSIWPSPENWDNPTLGRREEWNETVAGRLKQEFPGIEAYVIPSSLTIRRVANAADAGLIPGLPSNRGLYKDAGHMGDKGAYVIAATIVPMMYGVSPLELPHYMFANPAGDRLEGSLPVETAKEIQLIVMDTLAAYPHDGFETDLWITVGRLEPALRGRPYAAELSAAHAADGIQRGDTATSGTLVVATAHVADGIQWEVDPAGMPPGLALQGNRIQGTPSKAGRYRIPVRASAGGDSVSREVFLEVAEERPLEIATPDIPNPLDVDQYVLTEFADRGGIGLVTYSLVAGELPPGWLFLDGGLLRGTPGKSGEFQATIRATDSHPDGPRTADYALDLRVNPPDEDTLIARPIGQPVEYKIPFEDHDFSDLPFDYTITDDSGNPIAEVGFGWTWNAKERHREEKPAGQVVVAVKILEAEVNGISMESAHFYIDGNHNREVIYNEDDVHYMFKRGYNHKSNRAEEIQGYRGTRLARGFTRTGDDGTWMVVAGFGANVFRGAGVHVAPGPDRTFGFDVAIGSIDDPERRFYLRGNSGNDEDTGDFGSLLLLE